MILDLGLGYSDLFYVILLIHYFNDSYAHVLESMEKGSNYHRCSNGVATTTRRIISFVSKSISNLRFQKFQTKKKSPEGLTVLVNAVRGI